jgi:RNA polymerase sigma-54 factor
VELNSEALPRVLVNREYIAQIHSNGGNEGGQEKQVKTFLNEQLANANWLVKALDQRAETILKVAQEIVKQQEKFLLHGIRFLKPLVLRDIAAAIGMHESTISRVTTAKFLSTPRGLFEMKFFFTSSVGGAVGDAEFSSKTVMHYIRELVDAESAEDILSDDAIVKQLKHKNIDVARRTVTKYREAMQIPSSVVRRRQKKGA